MGHYMVADEGLEMGTECDAGGHGHLLTINNSYLTVAIPTLSRHGASTVELMDHQLHCHTRRCACAKAYELVFFSQRTEGRKGANWPR